MRDNNKTIKFTSEELNYLAEMVALDEGLAEAFGDSRDARIARECFNKINKLMKTPKKIPRRVKKLKDDGELNLKMMLKDILNLVDTNFCMMMNARLCKEKPRFLQGEAKKMAGIIGDVYNIAHCLYCASCAGKYRTNNIKRLSKMNSQKIIKLFTN